jgi:molecular chaperone GrpE (heat shock protein)
MDPKENEKKEQPEQEAPKASPGQQEFESSTEKEPPRADMDQKEFDSKLDEYANRISGAVSDGVKRLEAAFERGRENVRADEEGLKGFRGTPKMGLLMVIVGIIWLLYTLGVFGQPVFPILLIGIGAYFLVRNR